MINMNNTQIVVSVAVIIGVLALAYVLAKQGKTVELNALGVLKLKVSNPA